MADKLIITRGLLLELLRYEPETGKLYWRERSKHLVTGNRASAWNTRYSGKEAGRISCGYISLGIITNGFTGRVQAHRAIWLMTYGEWPQNIIDHIDGDRCNNRIENLRDVTHSINSRNAKRKISNKSGCPGVCYRPAQERWVVQLLGKHIGCFTNKADAIAARKKAEAQLGYHPNHGR